MGVLIGGRGKMGVLAPLALAMGASIARGQDGGAVEQWGIFEVALQGPAGGNPFVEESLKADFTQGTTSITVTGFYDGEGRYLVRFSPPTQGEWRYVTHSNSAMLEGKSGEFVAAAPGAGDHGPVRVHDRFHFAYADGAAYAPIGTTCYYWVMQNDALEDQTLATLKGSPFNKIRMFVMPAADAGGMALYPFAGTPPKSWDFTRFTPAFFQHLERRVKQLQDLGIEADLILFNPYDKGRWGYDNMGAANDDRYLRYVVARLASYRNVWWSLANEFDLSKTKTDADWDRFFQIVAAEYPYGHLRSIHHSMRLYDYWKPWVTHASLQNGSAVEDFGRAELYRDVYSKPIVLDEVKYEGDFVQRWGQLTGEEMVSRFWQGTIAGTYVGHSESFRAADGVVWMNQGGTLHGESPGAIGFLKRILAGAPGEAVSPIDKWQDVHTAGVAGKYYLIYFGSEMPTAWGFELPKAGLKEGMRFHVDVLDTWNMTVSPVGREFTIDAEGKYRYRSHETEPVALPGRKYMALRLTRAEAEGK